MKRTLIISAFPACGKTYLCNNEHKLLFNANGQKIPYTFLEVESSKFNKTKGWEREYVDRIEENIGECDFIFISQYEEVLLELQNRGIPFVTVTPDNASWTSEKERLLIKQQWFGRFVLRDNAHISDLQSWMKNLAEHYDEWTSVEHITKYNPVSFFLLNENQYLSDIIEDLYWKKETYDQYIM